jgi:hypothetical protein
MIFMNFRKRGKKKNIKILRDDGIDQRWYRWYHFRLHGLPGKRSRSIQVILRRYRPYEESVTTLVETSLSRETRRSVMERHASC